MPDSNDDQNTPKTRRLMIVEDDQVLALILSNQLRPFGFEVCAHCSTEAQVLPAIKEHNPDIVILDINLGSGGSGIAIADQLRSECLCPYVFLTAHAEDDIMRSALATAPYGYIVKPSAPVEIKATLETALIRYKMELKEKKISRSYAEFYDMGRLVAWSTDGDTSFATLSDYNSLINNIGRAGHILKSDLLKLLPREQHETITRKLDNRENFRQRFSITITDRTTGRHPGCIDIYIVDYDRKTDTVIISSIVDATLNDEFVNNIDHTHSLIDVVNVGYFFLNSEFRIISVNKYIYDLLGYKDGQLDNTHINEIISDDRRHENLANPEYLATSSRFEVNLVAKNRSIVPVLGVIDKIAILDNSHQYVFSVTNLSHIRSQQQILSRIAYTDPLTGIGNRAYFYHIFDMIDQGKIQGITSVCCIFIDLDSFKLINDNFGHSVGDDVLKIVSERMKDCLRGTDYLARLGGDEFVVVIINSPDDDALGEMATKFIDTIKKPICVGKECFSLTCSIGISLQQGKKPDSEKLLREADIAMYHSKSLGKDQYAFYSFEQSGVPLSRMVLEQGLRSLLKENSLIAYYQPILDGSQNIIAFEVLARWFHEKYHWISPMDFISVAEQTGMIHALGAKMLQQACIALKILEHVNREGLIAYVNVSPYQLRCMDFVKQAVDIAAEFEVNPSRIAFEITESSMTHANEISVIQELKNEGFRLAVDDFGTGYSALSNLKDYFANTIKLDKSFLHLADENSRHRVILERVTDLCLALGYDVLAEGVETQSQMERARDCGCRLFQGFYFHKPVDLQHFLQLSCDSSTLASMSVT